MLNNSLYLNLSNPSNTRQILKLENGKKPNNKNFFYCPKPPTPIHLPSMQIRVDNTSGTRLDVFLASQLPELSRARIQALLKSGDILVNNRSAKPKNSVTAGDTITVNIPEPESEDSLPEDLPIEILFEDDHLIVLNKASGMVVHPANGNRTGTLVNALLHHCKGQLALCAGTERPGIVHRLDKDTSGCIVVAKSDHAHQSLVKQFAERQTSKQYLAVVQGTPLKPQDTIFTHIGRHPVNRLKMAVVNPGSGKTAITRPHGPRRHPHSSRPHLLQTFTTKSTTPQTNAPCT